MGRAFRYQVTVNNPSGNVVNSEGHPTTTYTSTTCIGAVSRTTMDEENAITGALTDGAAGTRATLMVLIPASIPVAIDSQVVVAGTERGWADGSYGVIAIQKTPLHTRVRVRSDIVQGVTDAHD